MGKIFVFVLLFSFLISCQTIPEPPLVETEIAPTTPIEAPPVPATISEKPSTPAAQNLSGPNTKAAPILPSMAVMIQEPNTITNCPAGLNGGLVGAIEKGRHCFTNFPKTSGQCLHQQDKEVVSAADRYCQNLKNHWQRVGLWQYGPELDLRTELIKKNSCKCGLFRGKNLCKTFFEFECETIKK